MPTLSSENENAGVGSLRARFEVTNGPSSHVCSQSLTEEVIIATVISL